MFKEKEVGIKLPRNKERTENKPIEIKKPDEFLYFPVHGRLGRNAKIFVEVGDKVKIGSVLAIYYFGNIKINITSSVSGEVVGFKEVDTFRGIQDAVIVKNDFLDTEDLMEPLKDDATVADLVKQCREAGLIGTDNSLSTNKQFSVRKGEISYIFINGAECEGYSTAFSRVLIEYAEEIVKIAEYVRKIYDSKLAFITMVEDDTESVEAINNEIKKQKLDKVIGFTIPNLYPQDDSGFLIRKVLKSYKTSESYSDAGVLFSDVSTYKAVYDAVFKGLHFKERVVTVTGDIVKNPKNLSMRTGTLISSLLKECDASINSENNYIDGGPMMGRNINDLDSPIPKQSSTILALPPLKKRKESACVKCSGCVVICPVKLMPIKIATAYRKRQYSKYLEYNSLECMDCGLCSFMCPSCIDLAREVREYNNKVEELRDGKN